MTPKQANQTNPPNIQVMHMDKGDVSKQLKAKPESPKQAKTLKTGLKTQKKSRLPGRSIKKDQKPGEAKRRGGGLRQTPPSFFGGPGSLEGSGAGVVGDYYVDEDQFVLAQWTGELLSNFVGAFPTYQLPAKKK